MSNGKGDTPRPISVPPDVLEANWKATFPGSGWGVGMGMGSPQPPKPSETLGDPEE